MNTKCGCDAYIDTIYHIKTITPLFIGMWVSQHVWDWICWLSFTLFCSLLLSYWKQGGHSWKFLVYQSKYFQYNHVFVFYLWCYKALHILNSFHTETVALSQYKVFPGMGISIIKIRWPQDHLILIMEIPILVRWHLYIETSLRVICAIIRLFQYLIRHPVTWHCGILTSGDR